MKYRAISSVLFYSLNKGPAKPFRINQSSSYLIQRHLTTSVFRKAQEQLEQFFQNEKIDSSRTVAVALSGGVDSMVLWHLLTSERSNKNFFNNENILGITIDHQLRTASAWESQMVHEILSKSGFRHTILNCDWKEHEKKTSETARLKRYDLIHQFCSENKVSYLFAGHHADDQMETLTMRYSSGSGLYGLASIQPKIRFTSSKDFGTNQSVSILRPLLCLTKSEIYSISQEENVSYVEDPSNKNLDYSFRNRVRAQLSSPSTIDSNVNDKNNNVDSDQRNFNKNTQPLPWESSDDVGDIGNNDSNSSNRRYLTKNEQSNAKSGNLNAQNLDEVFRSHDLLRKNDYPQKANPEPDNVTQSGLALISVFSYIRKSYDLEVANYIQEHVWIDKLYGFIVINDIEKLESLFQPVRLRVLDRCISMISSLTKINSQKAIENAYRHVFVEKTTTKSSAIVSNVRIAIVSNKFPIDTTSIYWAGTSIPVNFKDPNVKRKKKVVLLTTQLFVQSPQAQTTQSLLSPCPSPTSPTTSEASLSSIYASSFNNNVIFGNETKEIFWENRFIIKFQGHSSLHRRCFKICNLGQRSRPKHWKLRSTCYVSYPILVDITKDASFSSSNDGSHGNDEVILCSRESFSLEYYTVNSPCGENNLPNINFCVDWKSKDSFY